MPVSKTLVKLMREERGWSQEQLAAISGISQRTVQRVEKEGTCSLESKMALASAFEISPKELEDHKKNDFLFEHNRVFWPGVAGYLILILILGIVFYFLTHTHGVWEIGSLAIVDGMIFAISITTYGLEETIRFFRHSFSPVSSAAAADSYAVYIVQANQIIKYAYTFGCLTALVYLLVTAIQTPDQYHNSNIILVEAATPVVYAIFLIELWIRPFKYRLEKRVVESRRKESSSE